MGTFVQGRPLPLVFKRVEKVETLNRPQNPKPPYPYDAQDVAYETSPGIKLAGTLTLPRGPGPFPHALRKLKVPVLALNGSRDLQVPPQ